MPQVGTSPSEDFQVKTIPLTQGKVALVDPDDYVWLSGCRSHASQIKPGHFVAVTKVTGSWVYMHRAILRAPQHLLVDHINHDPLDNRKCNLRLATHSQNNRNRKKHAGTSSRYKGVTWNKNDKLWHAQIRLPEGLRYLGRFDYEVDAALAYNEAAEAHFGEFAYINHVEDF